MTDLGWPPPPTDEPVEEPTTPVGWPAAAPPGDEAVPPADGQAQPDAPSEAEADAFFSAPDAYPVSPELPDYRPRDIAAEPLPPIDPAVAIRTALRDGAGDDTPIGAAAAAAVRVMNPSGQHDFPRPVRRRILTVANQKGGVGNTTSTVNLAAALALHGAEVLVIDLDPQGNASTGLGVDHHAGVPSIYEVLLDNTPIADVVQPSPEIPHLRCVPATIDLAGAEIELVSVVARESRLQRAIASYVDDVGKDVDYVIVDCPPSLGLLTLNALVAGREVLIPIQCEYYALEGLAQLLNTVELVRSHLNPELTVSTVLLTMYDSRTKLADQVASEVRDHFGDVVLTPVIPRNVRVSEAPGFGQTVMTYDAGSRGAIGYLQAAHEIAVNADRQESDG
jgi:chromosome partitioning protein